jgi:hypothetical protein
MRPARPVDITPKSDEGGGCGYGWNQFNACGLMKILPTSRNSPCKVPFAMVTFAQAGSNSEAHQNQRCALELLTLMCQKEIFKNVN